MRIVLATSPHVRHPAVLENNFVPDPSVMYSFAPVGLLSLSAVLREVRGLQPILFDTNRHIVDGSIPLSAAFYEDAADRICATAPDVFGFMTECDSYHHVLQIMAQVKRRRPACVCVLGGPHASAVALPTLARHAFVDAIVVGEGEHTFPALIDAVADDSDHAVPGAVRRQRDGTIVDGGPRPLVSTLDDLPPPAYDLYPGSREEEIFIEAGRGCPFQCTFCSTAPFWQRRHRVKSPARILDEIRTVQRLYGSKRVHFTHDLLTTDRRWVADLCRALIDAGTPVKWTCSARTDTVDRELLELMAAAGCNAMYFGLESGSPRVLQEIKKDIPIEDSFEILRTCRDVGIQPNGGFIVGFPHEDRGTVAETFAAYERALRMGVRPVYLFAFCPFAASSLYPRLENLACDGHFLDIPIEASLDAANRARIVADPQLFGSYFRPATDMSPTRLDGIDEFSPLAEAMALPTLDLSQAVGGMLEVFDRWTAWIAARNDAVGAPSHRRFYGSPLDFCEFLIEALRALRTEEHPMLQLTRVMRTTFEVAHRWSNAPPISMAAHRAIGQPDVGPPVQLGDRLRLNGLVATMRLDYDVIPLLDARVHAAPEPVRTPTYLMWDLSEDGRLRLSQVDAVLHAALERLQRGPQSVAALMAEFAGDQAADYERWVQVLSEAKSLRLVETL